MGTAWHGIAVAVSTTNRPEGYVHRTLSSLRETGYGGRATLCVCGTDSKYLDKYGTGKYLIKAVPSESSSILSQPISSRARYNYTRTLRSAGGEPYILAIEDDVVFARQWVGIVKKAITDLAKRFGNQWALRLFSSYPLPKLGPPWVEQDPRWCWGTQAILYPSSMAEKIATALSGGDCMMPRMYDLAMYWLLKRRGAHVIDICPSVTQHIGVKSTGMGGGGKTAPSFRD